MSRDGSNLCLEQLLENGNKIAYDEMDDGSICISQWYEEQPDKWTEAWAWTISPEEQLEAKIQPIDVAIRGERYDAQGLQRFDG